MLLLNNKYNTLIATIIFLFSVVLFIIFDSWFYLLIPFLLLSVPFIFQFCITKTESIFWLLIFLIPLSTELNITESLGIDFPDEICMILLTGMVLMKTLHQPKWFPNNFLQEPLFLLLLCIMAWTLISACFASDHWLAFKFFLARIWFIVPFVWFPQWVLRSKDAIKKLAFALLIPFAFIVIETLIRHAYYGFSFVAVKKTVFPFFRNHVNYSSMLVCMFPIIFAIYKQKSISKVFRNWILLGISLGLIALFFSYSRGAWLALIIGISYAFLMKKNLVKQFVFIVMLVLGIGISWLTSEYHYMRLAPDHDRTIFHTDFSEHMAATINMKDVSNAERFYRWVAGFKMFFEKPITGFGPNHFYKSYRPYTLNAFETWVSNNPEHSTIHNYFLLTLAEQGMPGLLLWLLLWFGMLFRLQWLFKNLQNEFYKTVSITVSIILVMILSINFMSDMIETDKIGSLFWLSLGLVFVLNRHAEEELHSIAAI